MNDKLNVFKKIAAIRDEMGILIKDGKNNHTQYRYVSHEQMTVKLRELLEKHQLVIVPEVESCEERPDGKNTRSCVMMNFEIVDLETGASIVKKFFGADQDAMGKSSGQAITEAVKRFQFKLFMVVSGDDPDPDRRSSPSGSPEINNIQSVPSPRQVPTPPASGGGTSFRSNPPPPPPKR